MAQPTQDLPEATLDTVQEMSDLLDTGLDRDALAVLTKLCDQGVNPAALAAVVKELQRERDLAAARPAPDAARS